MTIGMGSAPAMAVPEPALAADSTSDLACTDVLRVAHLLSITIPCLSDRQSPQGWACPEKTDNTEPWPDTVALIVAAGRGERAAKPGTEAALPKQYRDLAGQPVLRQAVRAFLHCTSGRGHFCRDPRRKTGPFIRAATAGLIGTAPMFGRAAAPGFGASRPGSNRNRAPRRDNVLIHDAARPFVSPAVIARVMQGLERADAVAPMIRVSDTLRRKTATGFRVSAARRPCSGHRRRRAFVFLRFSMRIASLSGESFTDDFALAERAGIPVLAVEGEEMNLKLTTPAISNWPNGWPSRPSRTSAREPALMCTALPAAIMSGFAESKFPHEFGLEGHSDADAGLHALTDALLGAIGAGDIGSHFPPTDERWRGAPSHIFSRHAASLVRETGGVIAHVDVTLICERPKIAPHREAMRQRIAEILGISPSTASASRRRPPKVSVSPAGARASRRRPSRRSGCPCVEATDDKTGGLARHLFRTGARFRGAGHIDICRCDALCNPAGIASGLESIGRRRSVAVAILGVPACGCYARTSRIYDPGDCVLDEVAGQWLALVPVALIVRAAIIGWPMCWRFLPSASSISGSPGRCGGRRGCPADRDHGGRCVCRCLRGAAGRFGGFCGRVGCDVSPAISVRWPDACFMKRATAVCTSPRPKAAPAV